MSGRQGGPQWTRADSSWLNRLPRPLREETAGPGGCRAPSGRSGGPGDVLCPGIRAKRVRSAWVLTDGVLKVEPTVFIDTLDEGWGESESKEPEARASITGWREWGLVWSRGTLRGLGLAILSPDAC